ncbi:hypothetical protein P3L10_025130 [Capsicum annuum]
MKSPQISTLSSSDDKESPELVIVIESDDKERYYFPYSQKDVNCKICMALDLIYEKPRYKPEPSEGTSEKKSASVIEMPSLDLKTTMGITQALRLHMEVQKQLREQVEIQRKLQLRIEEQGKYLEMMFERTKDIGKDFKVSSSITDEHPSPSTEPKHSPPNDKSEALEKDPVSLNDRSITGQESS